MPRDQDQPADASVISPAESPPEITGKAVILSVVLAAVLAAANAYLGLFAGMTVSASIPAAVAALAILRLFRRANILENNIVQTAASSGEALAAGIIFTIPAMVLIGAWPVVDYWRTAAIGLVGGLLGVLFTIPLRRALILGARLRFPEGVATAEVLKTGWGARTDGDSVMDERARAGLRTLLGGGLAGGLVKLGESGARLWSEAMEGATTAGGAVFYAGLNLSPALLAVGFIIGLNTALVVFLGGLLGWGMLLPLYSALNGSPPELTALAAARAVWSGKIRFVGIGAMLVGGLWTLLELRGPVLASLKSLVEASRDRAGAGGPVPRTERDAPLPWIVVPFLTSLLPMWLIYREAVGRPAVAAGMTLVMAVAAFLFSSVAAYMAGLVGSSSNPVSGVTIATLMLASLLLVAVMGAGHPGGPAAALLIGAVVCCAAAMGGDNLQDLKTGHLVGATPWKQQAMQVVGVATGALVLPPVLALLQAKYGIGAATEAHPHPLSAPQATLMASLAQGVFGVGLPWDLIGLGGLIGGAVILADRRLAAVGSGFRLPVLGVALGIYLPLKLSAAILLGGCVAEAARRAGARAEGGNDGLLFAAGLVTGEALMGIVLAVPLALTALWPGINPDPFALFEAPPLGAWPGLLIFLGVAALLFRTARRG